MGKSLKSSTNSKPCNMADALFSTSQQRVLTYIYGQPEKSFYASELIRLSAGGSGAIQRELARLEESGLVKVSNIGSQKHYQANPEAPIYSELKAIVQKTIGLVYPLKKALKPLLADIDAAFVYGSVAKRADTASSDIDLMLITENLTYADIFSALENTSAAVGRTINPTVYTKQEFKLRVEKGNSFIKRILLQPRVWIIGQDSDLPTG